MGRIIAMTREVPMTITEIEVDERGRASLKSAGVAPGRYRVSQVADAFKLELVKSYTATELLALNDQQVREAHQAMREAPERFTPAADLP
jgi:hypothetical protein